mmetsp:Transcript_2169/g.6858  ORF Transcript_2169/g.6858 Transcript_2169/m.6858 type:complete len:233 (-) Transcript_2169:450-1148(-)
MLRESDSDSDRARDSSSERVAAAAYTISSAMPPRVVSARPPHRETVCGSTDSGGATVHAPGDKETDRRASGSLVWLSRRTTNCRPGWDDEREGDSDNDIGWDSARVESATLNDRDGPALLSSRWADVGCGSETDTRKMVPRVRADETARRASSRGMLACTASALASAERTDAAGSSVPTASPPRPTTQDRTVGSRGCNGASRSRRASFHSTRTRGWPMVPAPRKVSANDEPQ